MLLSLVIPCYNEAKGLPALIARCSDVVAQGGIEILLVNNGSTDDSAAVLQQVLGALPAPQATRLRVVEVAQNQGYGFGILSGLRAAGGDILGWTHADLQTDPMDAMRGRELFLRHGKQLFVKGRRYGRPVSDTLFTIGMSAFESVLLGTRFWDINAQPTLFSREFFASWGDAPHDFSLDLYAYYQARQAGLAVHRYPVLFAPRVHGTSHWNVNWAAKRKFIRRTVDFSLQLRRRVVS